VKVRRCETPKPTFSLSHFLTFPRVAFCGEKRKMILSNYLLCCLSDDPQSNAKYAPQRRGGFAVRLPMTGSSLKAQPNGRKGRQPLGLVFFACFAPLRGIKKTQDEGSSKNNQNSSFMQAVFQIRWISNGHFDPILATLLPYPSPIPQNPFVTSQSLT